MRLKDLREDHDMTQAWLARRLNIGQNTYSQYENGQRQLPIPVLIQLAEIFGTSTDYILELTDIPTPYPSGRRAREQGEGSVGRTNIQKGAGEK